jgi:hypothetical protein
MEENPYEAPKLGTESAPFRARRIATWCCFIFALSLILYATGIATFAEEGDVGNYREASLRLSGAAAALLAVSLYLGGRRWRIPVAVMGLGLLHIGFQLVRRSL